MQIHGLSFASSFPSPLFAPINSCESDVINLLSAFCGLSVLTFKMRGPPQNWYRVFTLSEATDRPAFRPCIFRAHIKEISRPAHYRLGLQSSMLLLRWSIVSPRNPVSRMLTETNIHVREHPTRCEPSVTKQNTRFVTLFFIFRVLALSRVKPHEMLRHTSIASFAHVCVSPRDLSSLDMNPSALRAWYAPD